MSELAAGPELDAQVAERVMDLVVFRAEADVPDGWQHLPGETRWPMYGGGTFCFSLPAYSTDIAAAWQVVERLREQGYSFELLVEDAIVPATAWTARLQPAGSPSQTQDAYGYGATAPEAICRAALDALKP